LWIIDALGIPAVTWRKNEEFSNVMITIPPDHTDAVHDITGQIGLLMDLSVSDSIACSYLYDN
jgi:hypothetical protein